METVSNVVEPIESVLINIVDDLVQDWGIDLDGGINDQTLLVADLEFASVDVIQLCVAIEQHYGFSLEFQDLLMKNGSYVSDLSIRQMADFILKRVQARAS